ncbi:hypothetical protein AHA02nite_05020 [Alkalibacillus haloalkaliphilus]|uniref:Uncharacterized protein n=1 Tax=Alkalibacillus haloalkaliphilus TaxID=94136 RepID=A0A511W0Y2_9BACI|nr:hypothetical protein AHA02nite_05020 [Alkalibacillus haloalkaliphilus]
MGTARAENHPKRHGSEFWEVEAVPMESEVYFHCGVFKPYLINLLLPIITSNKTTINIINPS